jgi:hypothetical protein
MTPLAVLEINLKALDDRRLGGVRARVEWKWNLQVHDGGWRRCARAL